MHDTIDALHSKSLKVSKDKRNTSGSDLTVTSIKDKDMLNDEWLFTGYVCILGIYKNRLQQPTIGCKFQQTRIKYTIVQTGRCEMN